MAADVVTFQPDETNVPRMLSIKDAAKETGLPEHFIRSLALGGQIPAIRAGSKKIWLNFAGLVEYLSSARL